MIDYKKFILKKISENIGKEDMVLFNPECVTFGF